MKEKTELWKTSMSWSAKIWLSLDSIQYRHFNNDDKSYKDESRAGRPTEINDNTDW